MLALLYFGKNGNYLHVNKGIQWVGNRLHFEHRFCTVSEVAPSAEKQEAGSHLT